MYSVDITNNSDYLFNVKSKDYEFSVDVNGKGVTPPDAFLASLGTCIGVYVRKYANGAKLGLGKFSVKVEADLSKDAPVCFKKINVQVDLKGAGLDERRLKALHEFVKNCPVHNTIKNNPEVEIIIS
ncbi:MAG: OsmC family protein [Candidatus Omnitrophica bacterium]|nr:OsmC family protein [Candidatus Omnitrophota bacterium]